MGVVEVGVGVAAAAAAAAVVREDRGEEEGAKRWRKCSRVRHREKGEKQGESMPRCYASG